MLEKCVIYFFQTRSSGTMLLSRVIKKHHPNVYFTVVIVSLSARLTRICYIVSFSQSPDTKSTSITQLSLKTVLFFPISNQ